MIDENRRPNQRKAAFSNRGGMVKTTRGERLLRDIVRELRFAVGRTSRVSNVSYAILLASHPDEVGPSQAARAVSTKFVARSDFEEVKRLLKARELLRGNASPAFVEHAFDRPWFDILVEKTDVTMLFSVGKIYDLREVGI